MMNFKQHRKKLRQKIVSSKPSWDALVNAHSAELAVKKMNSAEQRHQIRKTITLASIDLWLSRAPTKSKRERCSNKMQTVTAWSTDKAIQRWKSKALRFYLEITAFLKRTSLSRAGRTALVKTRQQSRC